MSSVNKKLLRWTGNVRDYLFTKPAMQRSDRGQWSLAHFRRQIEQCIEAPLGEMEARKQAAAIGTAWVHSDSQRRREVLVLLANEFGPDRTAIEAGIEAWRRADEAGTGIDAAAANLREALKPGRVHLLTRFTSLPDGVKFLVDLREELLTCIGEDPGLRALDDDLRALFLMWFDQGFLDIQRITWHSSASLLEKLMEYESIHSIVSWQDLKNRLDRDRRCYTLFHPRMPNEPLAILHVALTREVVTNVQQLLQVDTPPEEANAANTAVFYSVTSPQQGLKGISFGEYIIKQAVRELQAELPNLETFVTLSPIPGFRLWLEKNLEESDYQNLPVGPESLGPALDKVAKGEKPDWLPALERLMHRKCLEYLTSTDERGRPLNPVTRFHLRNGAFIQRINFMGDRSDNGLRSACGMMVNYGYNLKTLENNLAHIHEGRLAVSSKLLRQARSDKLETEHLETG